MEDSENTDTGNTITADQLLSKCRALQEDATSFRARASAQNTTVEMGAFLKSVAAEMRSLERLASMDLSQSVSTVQNDLDEGPSQLRHALRSSNLSFLETIWNMATRCRNVVALSRRESSRHHTGNKSHLIDVVAEMGLLWVKIVTLGERKLLFEMAKDGWDVGWDDSEDEDENGATSAETNIQPNTEDMNTNETEDSEPTLPLLKLVKGLIQASKDNKVQYRHPEVLIWFSNLQAEKAITPAVSKVLVQLRKLGATVHCGSGEIQLQTLPALGSGNTAEKMLPLVQPLLTPVLNLDCTILLALVSDLSHMNLDAKAAYNEPLQRQLAAEQTRPLLTSVLYPALINRRLTTSRLAANRMRDIVETLGTPGERARTDILLKAGSLAVLPDAELGGYLTEESIHDVPADLLLPVQIVDSEPELGKPDVPVPIHLLDGVLSDINRSVFLLGWIKNQTTITSNRAVVKQIENIIYDAPGNLIGPDIYLIDVARSLVGKERASRRVLA